MPKIEAVARLIAFLVLVLETVRFFHRGYQKLQQDDNPISRPTPPAAPAGGAVILPISPEEDERFSNL